MRGTVRKRPKRIKNNSSQVRERRRLRFIRGRRSFRTESRFRVRTPQAPFLRGGPWRPVRSCRRIFAPFFLSAPLLRDVFRLLFNSRLSLVSFSFSPVLSVSVWVCVFLAVGLFNGFAGARSVAGGGRCGASAFGRYASETQLPSSQLSGQVSQRGFRPRTAGRLQDGSRRLCRIGAAVPHRTFRQACFRRGKRTGLSIGRACPQGGEPYGSRNGCMGQFRRNKCGEVRLFRPFYYFCIGQGVPCGTRLPVGPGRVAVNVAGCPSGLRKV